MILGKGLRCARTCRHLGVSLRGPTGTRITMNANIPSRSSNTRRRHRSRRHWALPRVELLEDRTLLAGHTLETATFVNIETGLGNPFDVLSQTPGPPGVDWYCFSISSPTQSGQISFLPAYGNGYDMAVYNANGTLEYFSASAQSKPVRFHNQQPGPYYLEIAGPAGFLPQYVLNFSATIVWDQFDSQNLNDDMPDATDLIPSIAAGGGHFRRRPLDQYS